MYEKIHCVNHVGKNLLIVGYNQSQQWQFRIVTSNGDVVQEKNNFPTAPSAMTEGEKWINENL